MPEFEHIDDTRQRLLARLNYMLRSRPVMESDDILMEQILDANAWALWTDFNRDVIAQYIVRQIEDEFGIDLIEAIKAAR
jgi:hypothetical protein